MRDRNLPAIGKTRFIARHWLTIDHRYLMPGPSEIPRACCADDAGAQHENLQPRFLSWTRLLVRLGGMACAKQRRSRLMPARRRDKAGRPTRRASGCVALSPSG